MNQVTFHAAITGTTPGIVTELLTRTGGDPTSATTGPAPTQTPTTSNNTASGFTRLPMLRKTDADHEPAGRAALVRAAVTTTAVYCIVKLPPTASMAAPMPASNSSSVAGGIWPWPPKVGICSSHSSRV